MTPSSRSRSREFARANVQLYTYRFLVVAPGNNREFKIRRLRTTATVKHATAHDQNHVTVNFSQVVLRLR